MKRNLKKKDLEKVSGGAYYPRLDTTSSSPEQQQEQNTPESGKGEKIVGVVFDSARRNEPDKGAEENTDKDQRCAFFKVT